MKDRNCELGALLSSLSRDPFMCSDRIRSPEIISTLRKLANDFIVHAKDCWVYSSVSCSKVLIPQRWANCSFSN